MGLSKELLEFPQSFAALESKIMAELQALALGTDDT